MDRRDFLGFSVSTVPLVGLVGPVGVRSLEQFATLPLPAPGPELVEWLNEAGERPRLGRYGRLFTEKVLLEAVATCGIEKPRTITLSPTGCGEYLVTIAGERRYSSYEQPKGKFYDYAKERSEIAEDALMLMSPGRQLRIEVHVGLPDGFLTIG